MKTLSEGTFMSGVMEKLKEYADKGAPNIWLTDPRGSNCYALIGRRRW
jgi:hypothetical protein